VFSGCYNIKCVLFLSCSSDISISRISKRAVNSSRVDDNDESLKKRFTVFQEETIPNIDELKKETEIIIINAEPSVDEVFEQILEKLNLMFFY